MSSVRVRLGPPLRHKGLAPVGPDRRQDFDTFLTQQASEIGVCDQIRTVPAMNDAWLTIADLADRWSVSKQTARQRTLEADFRLESAPTGPLLRCQA